MLNPRNKRAGVDALVDYLGSDLRGDRPDHFRRHRIYGQLAQVASAVCAGGAPGAHRFADDWNVLIRLGATRPFFTNLAAINLEVSTWNVAIAGRGCTGGPQVATLSSALRQMFADEKNLDSSGDPWDATELSLPVAAKAAAALTRAFQISDVILLRKLVGG